MSCMFASQVSRYSNTGPSLRQAAATWSAGAAAPSLKPSRSWPNCFIDLANLPEHPKTSILRWHDDMGTSDFWMPVDSGRSLILDSLLLNYSWLLTLDQEHANDCSQWLIENRKQKELPRLTLFVDNPCLSIGNDVRCDQALMFGSRGGVTISIFCQHPQMGRVVRSIHGRVQDVRTRTQWPIMSWELQLCIQTQKLPTTSRFHCTYK